MMVMVVLVFTVLVRDIAAPVNGASTSEYRELLISTYKYISALYCWIITSLLAAATTGANQEYMDLKYPSPSRSH